MFLEEQTLPGNFLNINVVLLQNLLEVKRINFIRNRISLAEYHTTTAMSAIILIESNCFILLKLCGQ